MKREILSTLNKKELDQYAATLGLDTSDMGTVAEKVDAIDEARGHVAKIRAMGMTLTIPIKRIHDLRITTRLSGSKSDDELMDIAKDILGDEQMQAVYDHCTDDDGTVDAEAVSVILANIVTSDKLKNF